MVLGLDYALANVIRTTATDVILRPSACPRSNHSCRFVRGADYDVIDAVSNITLNPDFRSASTEEPNKLTNATTLGLKALAGGKIHTPGMEDKRELS